MRQGCQCWKEDLLRSTKEIKSIGRSDGCGAASGEGIEARKEGGAVFYSSQKKCAHIWRKGSR